MKIILIACLILYLVIAICGIVRFMAVNSGVDPDDPFYRSLRDASRTQEANSEDEIRRNEIIVHPNGRANTKIVHGNYSPDNWYNVQTTINLSVGSISVDDSEVLANTSNARQDLVKDT